MNLSRLTTAAALATALAIPCLAAPAQAAPTGVLVVTVAGPATPVVTGVAGQQVQAVNTDVIAHQFKKVVSVTNPAPYTFTIASGTTAIATPPNGVYQDVTVGGPTASVAFVTA